MVSSAAPRVRILLQSRMASTRLPAKAMLTVAGFPLVVLTALRAARSGFPVVVATSVSAADDPIAAAAAAAGLAVFRGPEDDVLDRFVQASADLDDADVVVRLTGDNVLPDGPLVRLLVEEFLASGAAYLSTVWPDDGIPYGLSCEATRAGELRRARAADPDAFDREHVTPWIRRACGVHSFPSYGGDWAWGHLRVTIDNLDDYLRMVRAFAGVADPVNEPWQALVARIAADPDAPRFLVPADASCGSRRSRMVLGGVQLGLPYGIANRTGRPDAETAARIVRTAVAHGVTDIDTARAYGDSERVIGLAMRGGRANDLRVVTKLDPLAGLADDAAPEAVDAMVEASVFRSCRELGLAALPVLLLHRTDQLSRCGGRVWRRLRELKAAGVIGLLGVSVQTPEEAFAALAAPEVEHLQMPGNLLDWRWEEAGLPAALAARPEVTVHLRSAFLQGLLANPDTAPWPRLPGFPAESAAATLSALVRELGRDGADDLALAWVNGLSWAHGIVVGLETPQQLARNLDLFRRSPLSAAERARVREALPRAPKTLLNPALWPKEPKA